MRNAYDKIWSETIYKMYYNCRPFSNCKNVPIRYKTVANKATIFVKNREGVPIHVYLIMLKSISWRIHKKLIRVVIYWDCTN